MRKRRVVILGATGSIGKSARKVARDIPDRMEVVGLSANFSADDLAQASREFPAARCVLAQGDVSKLIELATLPTADLVLIAIVGTAGLRPALAAIEAGKDIAIASKEILVMAGEIIMAAARARGVQVLPVDSEHNAIFQCLEGRDPTSVKRLILTCSGGPFRCTPVSELTAVTPAMALRHPTWTMGPKITIDSATLFNKALEIIEARWLFNIEMERVDVIVHPQSIVHSMVEFVDGSLLAQLSHSDMGFPIHYAVTWPERVASSLPTLDFAELGRLDFEAPRRKDFPALDLAVRAGTQGGVMPAVLNAANELAVEAFLAERISFLQIAQIVEAAMDRGARIEQPTLEQILEADANTRVEVASLISHFCESRAFHWAQQESPI